MPIADLCQLTNMSSLRLYRKPIKTGNRTICDNKSTQNVFDEDKENEVLKKGVCLSEQTQAVVLHVYQVLKNEIGGGGNLVNRVSELTGISKRTIYRLIEKGDVTSVLKRGRQEGKFKKIDDFDKALVARTVYTMFANNILPTIDLIFDKLIEECSFPYKRSTLKDLLKSMGFKYRKYEKKNKLFDSARIKIWRFRYLNKIKEARAAGKQIVYLDETWFDTHDTTKMAWSDSTDKCTANVPAARGKRLVILHALTDSGFMEGCDLISCKEMKVAKADYHQDMTADLFERWMELQLLPALEGPTMIVMDNAPYHSRLLEQIPTMGWRKGDIITFMKNKNIPLESPVPIKEVLVDKIKSKQYEKTYVVDKMAQWAGHEILRLPPYHCILNPIEMAWSQVKRELRKRNTTCLTDNVIDHLRDCFKNVTKENCSNYVDHVIKVENTFRSMDEYLDNDDFIISVSDESDSDFDFDH